MNSSRDNDAVTVIGLGNMGSALAAALLANNYPVVVWNRTAAKANELVESGAALADSPTKACAETNITIVCLAEHDAIKSVVLTDEVAKALKGKQLVQMGVVTAEQAKEAADWAHVHEVGYLECSILGVPDNIAAGKATLICSGGGDRYAQLKPILENFGNPQHLSDKIGAAYEFDKIIYPFGYGAMLGFMQGAAMAQASGFSVEAYTNILTEWMKPLGSRLENFGKLIAEEDFTANQATLEAWTAGYEKSLDLCRTLGVDDTYSAALMSMLKRAIEHGYGDAEIIAVIKTLLPKD